MTREEFFYQCMDIIEHWLNGNRKLSDLREVTDKLYNEVTRPHWISVGEQDIPLGQWVITYAPNEFIYCNIDVEFLAMDETAEDFGITHWMPLPQPPKEGGEE